MTRKNYGAGSLFERSDGRWEATATINGKRKSFYGKTKTEAREKRTKALASVARGEYVDISKMKTGEYLQYWVGVHANTTELVTAQTYRQHIRVHFIPHLGHIPLQKLSTQDIQRMYDALTKQGRKPSTLNSIHIALRAALNDAVRWGKLAKNPCHGVKLPKAKKREQLILTKDQADQLIAACQDALSEKVQLGAILLLLITTGIRIGEALSLHWSDIDFEKKVLYVANTLSYDKEQRKLYEADPKSESGQREIALSKLAISTLSAHRHNQIEQRLMATTWEDHNLVFTSLTGKHTWDSSVRYQFKVFLRKLGLPEMHPHDLRHNIATALIAAGVPMKTVQNLLGHAKLSTTMDLYGHVSPEMKQSAADEVDRIFGQG